jgi:hypothetical protein
LEIFFGFRVEILLSPPPPSPPPSTPRSHPRESTIATYSSRKGEYRYLSKINFPVSKLPAWVEIMVSMKGSNLTMSTTDPVQ